MLISDFVILLILLVLSAFFSGSETAFMNLKLHRKGISSKFKAILKNEELFLTSVLIANTVINISIAVICIKLTQSFNLDNIPKYIIWIIEIFFVGLLILLFGEILPKRLAVRKSLKFAKVSYIPLVFFLKIITPLAFVINFIINLIIALFPFIKKEKV